MTKKKKIKDMKNKEILKNKDIEEIMTPGLVKQVMSKKEKISKEVFIKKATKAGFTKRQANFLYRVCFEY